MEKFILLLVPLLAIGLGICTGMLAIFLTYRRRKEMFALYHQERMAAIEKGIELPPLPQDFFHEDNGPSRRSPHQTLLVGLILVFLGVTMFLAMHLVVMRTQSGADASYFALIPGGCGVAFLIYYFTVGKKVAAAMEEERKARLAAPGRVPNPRV
jgi:hypothetical protein